MNKKKDKKRSLDTCNICGLPGMVTYQEQDSETGKMKTVSHKCDCLGHQGICEYLWNKHPNYKKYKAMCEKQRDMSRKSKE